MASSGAPNIAARLDRLPSTRVIWAMVALLAFGAFFEIWDISLTSFMSPMLVKAGIFHKGAKGMFGLSDQATFAACTFAGLWIGTLIFSFIADRLGRRPIFAVSLVWYCLATVIMGLQNSAAMVDLWRFIAGVGIGVQLVAIDCYLAELMPKRLRGRAFAISTVIQFTANPMCAFLALALAPHGLFGIAGWRWLAFVPALGAAGVWFVQRSLPESPRWLAEHGFELKADAIVSDMERRSEIALRAPLPSPEPSEGPSAAADRQGLSSLLRPPLRARFYMMIGFQLLQTIGYYGFSNWVPSLLEARGVNLKDSLAYSGAIALTFPLAPLIFYSFADRIERKWQITAGALGAAVFGLIFAQQSAAAGWIVFGVLTAFSGNLMSYGYHTYQSELFPTRIRARAVGITYSFSRLSAIFSSFIIAYLLENGGVPSVFVFISGSLLGVAVIIGLFGPRTRNRSLEDIVRAEPARLASALETINAR
ncbi:MAG TPA: MFS transporter [Phenylobacterium sp.]|nr:MFS transporter [Phenylobacterium sp.]